MEKARISRDRSMIEGFLYNASTEFIYINWNIANAIGYDVTTWLVLEK
jgi:hypothetical protein